MPALILGAIGNVGPHVVTELVATGGRPRVLVRDGDRARELFGDTADIVSGDVTAPGVVEDAAEGMDSIFLLSPHSFAMADLQLGVIRALRRRDIRVVKLSGRAQPSRPTDRTPVGSTGRSSGSSWRAASLTSSFAPTRSCRSSSNGSCSRRYTRPAR